MIQRDVNATATWCEFFHDTEFSEGYIEFLHEQTLCMVDQDKVKKKLLRGKCVLEIVTASDETQAVFNYINNSEKWIERYQKRDDPADPIHKDRSGGKYASSKGRGRFKSGYTEEGKTIYDQALAFFKKARTNKEGMFEHTKNCKKWYDASMLKKKVESGRRKKKGHAAQINAPAESMPALPLPDDVLEMMRKGGDSDSDDDDYDMHVNDGHLGFDEAYYDNMGAGGGGDGDVGSTIDQETGV